ncbi:unnamed protein product, partial [Musa hybrid cultivar]
VVLHLFGPIISFIIFLYSGIYQGQQQPPGNRHLEINPKEKLFGC